MWCKLAIAGEVELRVLIVEIQTVDEAMIQVMVRTSAVFDLHDLISLARASVSS